MKICEELKTISEALNQEGYRSFSVSSAAHSLQVGHKFGAFAFYSIFFGVWLIRLLVMASLSPGILEKLIQNMNVEEETGSEKRTPLLQVIGIIPVRLGHDLWPNQGFYLKVSDSSHAMYVSLPQEHDEMILSNKLQLGQFIYVQKLELASPVPIIRGMKALPGRHSCVGNPKDLVITTSCPEFLAPLFDSASKIEISNDFAKTALEKPRSSSASRIIAEERRSRKELNFHSGPTSPINCFSNKCDFEKNTSDIVSELSKISVTCVDEESDSDSSRSSYSFGAKAPRRSWDRGSTTRIKERSGQQIVKHKAQPLLRTQSADLCPSQFARYDVSGSKYDFVEFLSARKADNKQAINHEIRPISRTRSAFISSAQFTSNDSCVSVNQSSIYMPIRKTDIEPASKVFITSNKRKVSITNKTCSENPSAAVAGTCTDRKRSESNVMWTSLPSSLIKLGKEVLRQRDAALLASVEALQEAAAAERLIGCLSTYSALRSNKEDEPQSTVDQFLNLHEDLTQATYVTQSLVKISPSGTTTNDSFRPNAIKEAIKVALERKRCAASWIKAAVASDLSPYPPVTRPPTTPTETPSPARRLGARRKPNGTNMVSSMKKFTEGEMGAAVDKESLDWVKGSGLLVSTDLANSLQRECKRWFLNYVETFLDIKSKVVSTETESQIAGILCLIKRLDNWLGVISHKEGIIVKDGLEADEEVKARGRVRKKIYNFLLEHVESAAMALENMTIASTEELETEKNVYECSEIVSQKFIPSVQYQ